AVKITEIGNQGSVPELKLANKGKKGVLIIEGEELVGAKQNRIVNATFLIVGNTEVVIPVSCVEQGRWRYKSKEFSSSEKMMHASLRRKHQEDVKLSLKREKSYRSNQGRIWDDIADKSARMKVNSPTHAMADVYETYEINLSGFLVKFHLIECQVGAVFAINGQILGMEVFGCHDTFKRFFSKLIKSYALDALDLKTKNGNGSVPPDKVRKFISFTEGAVFSQHPSIGIGTNITLESPAVSGAGFVERKQTLHLSVFKKDENGNGDRARYQRYSTRRSRWL
ncbi:MAG: hypothetical protein JRJ76_14400, partial [Deltaproteobacteria bacterium]|nr:hypothetical protein [Deltaproteobacteria bacterium]